MKRFVCFCFRHKRDFSCSLLSFFAANIQIPTPQYSSTCCNLLTLASFTHALPVKPMLRLIFLLGIVGYAMAAAGAANNVTVPFTDYSIRKPPPPLPPNSAALFVGLTLGGLMFTLIGLFVSVSLAMAGPGGGYAAVGGDGKSALREYEIRL